MLQTLLRQVRRLRFRIAWGPLAWLACLTSPLLQAGDSVQIKTNYYRIQGDSYREIRQSLNTNRPWASRKQMDAYTTWEINWKFRTSHGPPFRLLSFETKTDIVINLPWWSPTSNAPPSLRQNWQRYMKALIQHEEGHKRIALEAANEARQRVEQVGPASTAHDLRSSIQETAKAVVSQYRRKDANYDRTTRHGATQGAHFP